MAKSALANLKVPGVLKKYHGMVLPIGALALILAILIPLPTSLMDFLLLVNITLSGVVLLTVMYINGPLEFSSFPSLLLGLTLFRLVLNTATTRLILTDANPGQVIETFGSFVARGSLAVAVIIFIIVVVIQFVVITKGATRIAEVAARFTLDGMPGKQMAVDADLNAGAITDEEAKRRRADITREADFYGAMDGASKFVRGDAIAGIIITIINILGGIFVGLVELDMSFSDTIQRFTILTIGDGLVSQIPAFIVSVAAAMIVTRSASQKNLGDELLGQLLSQPIALSLTAAFLATLALTPLPKPPLVLLGVASVVIAMVLTRSRKLALAEAAAARVKPPQQEKVEKFIAPDPMELEVGYGLIRLVDRKQGGDLLDRVANMRRQIAQELGVIVPPIRIRDNVQVQPNQYQVKLKGMQIGLGDVLPGHLLAIDPGTVTDRVSGMETTEPVFQLPALWILENQRHDAEIRNYTVVEPTSVISTHLTELIKRHADELVTRQEVSRLLDNLKERSPKLVEEVVPGILKPGEIQRVLQSLLRERVPIRDLESILEAAAECAGRIKDPEIMTEYARSALARTLSNMHRAEDGKIHCITLDPALEELINKHLDRTDRGTYLAMPPQMQGRVVAAVRGTVESASTSAGGRTPIILCAPQVRAWVRRLIESALPSVAVLSYNDVVRGVDVESHGMVSISDGT